MNNTITAMDKDKQILEILDSITHSMIDMCGSKVYVSDTKESLIKMLRKIDKLYVDVIA